MADTVKQDIITSFDRLLEEHTDIVPQFRKITAHSIIAQTLGRYYKLKDIGLRPNIYVMVSSPPKMGRRGDLTRFLQICKNSAFYQFYHKLEEIGYDIGESSYETEVKAHMLDGGSPQGLIDDINYFREKTYDSVAIVSTEFGKRLQAIIENKAYMYGMDSLLCKAYTGESDYESFSHRNDGKPRFLASGYYLNIFGSLQYVENYIKNKNFGEIGMARRFGIFAVRGEHILEYKKKLGKPRPLLGRNVDNLEKKLETLGFRLGDIMYQQFLMFNKTGELYEIDFEQQVFDYINKQNDELETLALKNDDDPYYLYRQGKFDQVLKYAMLRVISRTQPTITMDDIREAEILYDDPTNIVKVALERTIVPQHQKEMYDLIQRIYRSIVVGKTHTEILRSLQYHTNAEGVKKIYDILEGNHRIRKKEHGKGEHDYEPIL